MQQNKPNLRLKRMHLQHNRPTLPKKLKLQQRRRQLQNILNSAVTLLLEPEPAAHKVPHKMLRHNILQRWRLASHKANA